MGNDIASVLLGGIGKAAETMNQADRRVSFGGGTVATENNDPNMLAGAAEGAAKTAAERLRRQNQQSRRAKQQQPAVFAIDKGTDVQLIANQPFEI